MKYQVVALKIDKELNLVDYSKEFDTSEEATLYLTHIQTHTPDAYMRTPQQRTKKAAQSARVNKILAGGVASVLTAVEEIL